MQENRVLPVYSGKMFPNNGNILERRQICSQTSYNRLLSVFKTSPQALREQG